MNQRFTKFAAEQTASRGKKLHSELRRAMRTPEDPEAIHDLRVAIRRFTQCLRTFRQFLDRNSTKKIRRRLRKVMDACGAARNIDIALEVLAAAGAGGQTLLEDLRKERPRRQKRLVQRLKQWRRRKRFKALTTVPQFKRTAPGPWDGGSDAAANAARVLTALAAELFESGGRAAEAGSTHEDLHQFRLQAKRFRYTLELFGSVYGEKLDARIALLGGIQDKLGAMNDCVTTLPLIAGNASAEKSVRNLLAAREDDFRRYWRERAARSQANWVKWLGAAPKTAS
ncbi:MAG: CHAD domain-containing protein [Acidobacteriia bacterium]|nr:CHAD domain-containing protein [Terriglobia bacterium]